MSTDGGQGQGLLSHPSHLDDQKDCSSPNVVQSSQLRASLAGSSAEGCPVRQDHPAPAEQQQHDCSSSRPTRTLTSNVSPATSTSSVPGTTSSLAQATQKPVAPPKGETEQHRGKAPAAAVACSSGSPEPESQAQEGDLPCYALQYQQTVGVLPWKTLLVDGYDKAPWLSLLPPEAKGSLYEWGRYLFSQTPACKRGSVSIDKYGEWLERRATAGSRNSAPDILAKCCAAFAHSPLSLVIDMRAAQQCIGLAVKRVLGTERGEWVVPSAVEYQLEDVCASGCGIASRPPDHLRYALAHYGPSTQYCSQECATAHYKTLPQALHIYMCWPVAWTDAVFNNHSGDSLEDPLSFGDRTPESRHDHMTGSERKVTTEDMRAYLQQAKKGFDPYGFSLACMCLDSCRQERISKAFADIIRKYKTGSVSDAECVAGLMVLVYNNEHMFPGLRQQFGHLLPPRPFPVIQSSRPADMQSGLASRPGPGEERGASTVATALAAEPAGKKARKKRKQRKLAASASDQRTPTEPTPPLPTPSHPVPVSHTTPATTHAPDSPCTIVQRLTEADLARISDLAQDAVADASRDKQPMLWHVRRRAYERVCARMGLPAAGVQSLLWVASERGDAWGSLGELYLADPTGMCLPPELRTPFCVWICTSDMAYYLYCYALGQNAVAVIMESSVRAKLTTGEYSWLDINSLCATCGKHGDAAADLFTCPVCDVVSVCSEECCSQHKASGACKILDWRAELEEPGGEGDYDILPLSFFDLAAHRASIASDQQAPHTSDPTPDPSSPLQRDATATANCPAAAAVPAPSRSVTAQRTHRPVSAAQALAAEYRQCLEGNPLLQRVAAVVMPRGAEREPESAAVMAAQQLLIAASGLLDARDLEEVLAAAGA